MVLDTSAKRFKYSALKKAICIILAFITFMVSTSLVTVSIFTFFYGNGEKPESFTDTYAFSDYFGRIVCETAGNAYKDIALKNKKKSLEEQRESVVDKISKQYMADYKKYYNPADEFDYNDLPEDSYNISVKTTDSSDDFCVATYDLYHFNGESMPGDEETVNKIINELYSVFIDNSVQDIYYGEGDYIYKIKSLRCRAVYNDSEWSNLDSFNEKELYNSDIYFVYKDGKAQAKGINNKWLDSITSYLSNDYAKKTDVYVYFDFPENTENRFNILEYIDTYDYFVGLKDFHNTAVRCYDNFIMYIVFAVLMLIISFTAGIRYLLVAGKRDENAPAKLAFIDYVPFEIHLGALIGLGFLATYFIAVGIVESLQISVLSVWVMIIYAALMWLLVLEFSASVARNIMSDRKIYKNFLTYYILRLLFIILKGVFKTTVKLTNKIRKSIKEVFSVLSYSPKKFKRNVILIAVLYALCNLIAVIIIIWLFAVYLAPLGVLLTLADLGVNIYLLIKFLSYIKKLDMIICAVSNHEDIALDVDALPQSLKVLAEGMKYTNAQLQSAVAKAVKDERLRTELITNVSHDLKTPLTSIINYVDLLSKCGIEDEKAREYIKVLNDKGAKLKRLIDDLIEASKVTSGNITVNLTRLNLYELCLQAVVDVQEDFEKAGLDLIVKENGVAPAISADGPKSFRVIENLLSNARKYSAKASRVYVNVYEENGMGVFEIKNVSAQPLDISPDELTQRFVRGDKSRNQEGNGLGLSIAKELCRVQNGDLEISIDGDLFKARAKFPIAK